MKTLSLVMLCLLMMSSSVFATNDNSDGVDKESNDKCMLKEFYARNGKTDVFESKEFVHAESALDCFRSAMIKAELSKKAFTKKVNKKTQYLYVYWEFNDGYIWDSDGYVTRYTRDCTYRKDGSNAFHMSEEQYSYTMSASYYLYKEDCHTFNDY